LDWSAKEGSIHPDTGVELMEFQLPDWAIVRDLCLKVAMVFPNLRMQAFDIASSDRGPVVIEVNVGGDYNLPQLATGQGMLTPHFLKFFESARRTVIYRVRSSNCGSISAHRSWPADANESIGYNGDDRRVGLA
jgi:hypothetical protein